MKVIILAAGYAQRLYPLTLDKPKPLLPIADRPILSHVFSKVRGVSGVDGIYVVTNAKYYAQFYEWAKTENHSCPCVILNDGTKGNEERLGAIGDIQFVIRETGIAEDTLILAGDNLFDFALGDFVESYRKNGTSVACFELGDLKAASRYGVLELDQNHRILRFLEKPSSPPSSLISTGIYGYTCSDLSELGPYLKQGGNPDAPGHFLEWLSKRKDVYGFVTDGLWFDIGDLESYHKANEIYSKYSKT